MGRESLTPRLIILLLLFLFLVSVLYGLRGSITGAFTGAFVACNEPYVVIEGKCCLDENGNNVCDIQEEVTGSEVAAAGREGPTETKSFYLREYPEIERMFENTGSTLEDVLEQRGYNVTFMERDEGVKEIYKNNKTEKYDPLTGNYVFVAIDKERLTKKTLFDQGYNISEDVVSYMKSYYPDSDVWMILVHDDCNENTELGGNAILCMFSAPELNLGGCALREPTTEECYGIVTETVRTAEGTGGGATGGQTGVQESGSTALGGMIQQVNGSVFVNLGQA